MSSIASNDLIPNPIRTAAIPTLDIPASGLDQNTAIQPAWFRLTEALVKWLRFHFSSSVRIEHPDLIDRVWVSDPEKSPIFISSLAEFAPKSSQQRPSILVDRLDQEKNMQQRGIGDSLQGVAPGAYAHLMNGRHVVHCLGGREGEAEILAFEVWRELVRFAPEIGPRLCLIRLLPGRIGKRVQLSNEHSEHYTVPIEIGYSYFEQWRVYPTDEAEITAIKTMINSL